MIRVGQYDVYLRNRSAPTVNCWVIIHCLEVSCKEDQITSAQRVQLTDKQWIITQQFTHWSWSISILTHNKRRNHIRSLQFLPTFRHCTEELPPILRLRRISLHVIVTSFKRKNDVTPSNAMNDVIFQWRQLSHSLAVNYCPIYHSLLSFALKARCVRIKKYISSSSELLSNCCALVIWSSLQLTSKQWIITQQFTQRSWSISILTHNK